jgi:hypothetical protein
MQHQIPVVRLCGVPAIRQCLEIGAFELLVGEHARDSQTERGPRRRLRCARCGHVITEAEQRIVVGGSHAHRFANPSGWVYEIGCFRHAGGCAPVGEPDAEHTWFAGYRWQVAVCGQCGGHVGWRYQREEAVFHGLILERLTAEQ